MSWKTTPPEPPVTAPSLAAPTAEDFAPTSSKTVNTTSTISKYIESFKESSGSVAGSIDATPEILDSLADYIETQAGREPFCVITGDPPRGLRFLAKLYARQNTAQPLDEPTARFDQAFVEAFDRIFAFCIAGCICANLPTAAFSPHAAKVAECQAKLLKIRDSNRWSDCLKALLDLLMSPLTTETRRGLRTLKIVSGVQFPSLEGFLSEAKPDLQPHRDSVRIRSIAPPSAELLELTLNPKLKSTSLLESHLRRKKQPEPELWPSHRLPTAAPALAGLPSSSSTLKNQTPSLELLVPVKVVVRSPGAAQMNLATASASSPPTKLRRTSETTPDGSSLWTTAQLSSTPPAAATPTTPSSAPKHQRTNEARSTSPTRLPAAPVAEPAVSPTAANTAHSSSKIKEEDSKASCSNSTLGAEYLAAATGTFSPSALDQADPPRSTKRKTRPAEYELISDDEPVEFHMTEDYGEMEAEPEIPEHEWIEEVAYHVPTKDSYLKRMYETKTNDLLMYLESARMLDPNQALEQLVAAQEYVDNTKNINAKKDGKRAIANYIDENSSSAVEKREVDMVRKPAKYHLSQQWARVRSQKMLAESPPESKKRKY